MDEFLISETGYILILGWLADERVRRTPRGKLIGGETTIDLTPDMFLRHARPDIEEHVRPGAYDFGFVIFGKAPPRVLEAQRVTLRISTPDQRL